MKTEELQNQFDTTEKEYQAACARRNEAREELDALRKEVERLRTDATTKPATLARLLADLSAREMLLPAIESDMFNAHRHMMSAKQTIIDYGNAQKVKRIQLEAMQRELQTMQRDFSDKQHQLEFFEEAIQRHKVAVQRLEAELG